MTCQSFDGHGRCYPYSLSRRASWLELQITTTRTHTQTDRQSDGRTAVQHKSYVFMGTRGSPNVNIHHPCCTLTPFWMPTDRDRRTDARMSGQQGGVIFHVKRYSSSWGTHLKATECHLPYGITQCYVTPDTDFFITRNPSSQTSLYSTYPPQRDAKMSWPKCWLGAAISRLT